MSENVKWGLWLLALLAGLVYADAVSMNMSVIDTVRQLGTDLLHRFFY